MKRKLEERKKRSKLGRISVARDAEYNDGQGNLSKAVELIQAQLEVLQFMLRDLSSSVQLYQSPEYYFDLATMQGEVYPLSMIFWSSPVMLSAHEVSSTFAKTALDNFKQAQDIAYRGFRAGHRVKTRKQCEKDSSLYREWSTAPEPKVTLKTISVQEYGHAIKVAPSSPLCCYWCCLGVVINVALVGLWRRDSSFCCWYEVSTACYNDCNLYRCWD